MSCRFFQRFHLLTARAVSCVTAREAPLALSRVCKVAVLTIYPVHDGCYLLFWQTISGLIVSCLPKRKHLPPGTLRHRCSFRAVTFLCHQVWYHSQAGIHKPGIQMGSARLRVKHFHHNSNRAALKIEPTHFQGKYN